MKITFISPPVNLSGGVRVMVIHAQHLMRMGHEVQIVSPAPPSIPLRQKLQSWIRGNGWLQELSVRRSHLHGANIPHHVLDSRRPVVDQDVPDADVVIATWWETAEWVAALSPAKGAKVYFIQGHEVFSHLPLDRVRATYRLPLHKVVVARWLKDIMRAQYGDGVVDVVPNSVDRAQFFADVRGKQAVPTVGFLHSRASIKGMDLTLEAIRRIRERYPNLRVISFGSRVKETPQELPNGVEYHHSPPQNAIRHLYASCDAWITSSRSDGFNLPALEAMACRTPVVSTRVGWPEEAIKTGWNGVLVDVEDVQGIARGVESLLSLDDQAWRTVSANAYDTAAAGSWQQSAEMFEKALMHACRRAELGEIQGRCSNGTT